MNAALLALFMLFCFYLSYRYYARFLETQVFDLDSDAETPAHKYRDGVDFVPTPKAILFGHHFSSIAGAAPIVGPAIAVIWGWLPAILWVLIGNLFIGAVQDFGALAVSTKHDGSSIGNLTAHIIRPRARTLFLLIIFFLVLLTLAVFAYIIATLFVAYPATVFAINSQIIIAITLGFLIYRWKVPYFWPSVGAVMLLYLSIYVGTKVPIAMPPMLGLQPIEVWVVLLLAYAYVASTLPVWVLLQPRDYINSHMLFIGLGMMYLGLFIAHPTIIAPAIDFSPPEAPSILPFLFVTIACGAISGFHSLVSSGTTSKQLSSFRDARPIGYGSMVGEGCLAVIAILAATAGFEGRDAWYGHYASWSTANSLQAKLGAFLEGGAMFLGTLGIGHDFAVAFIGVLVVAFAATTLDTACRIQRYIIGEVGRAYGIPRLSNRWIGAAVAAGTALLLAVMRGGGQGGLILWPLFGGTNQLVGGMAMLVITVYLYRRGKPWHYTGIPMVFLVLMTSTAMLLTIVSMARDGDWLLFGIGTCVLGLEVWMVVEGVHIFRSLAADRAAQRERA